MPRMVLTLWATLISGVAITWASLANSYRLSLAVTSALGRIMAMSSLHLCAVTLSSRELIQLEALRFLLGGAASQTVSVAVILLSAIWCITGVTSRLSPVAEHWGTYPTVALLLSVLPLVRDLASCYVCIEGLALATYLIVGLLRVSEYSTEAALKYYVLSSVASLAYVASMALLYSTTGSMILPEVSGICHSYGWWHTNSWDIVVTALAGVWSAVAFKLAVAPFHLWNPDVIEGTSAVAVAFVAVLPKLALLAFLLQVNKCLLPVIPAGKGIIALAILSLLLGGVGAISQRSWRRMLAFAGTVQYGYCLLATVLPTAIAEGTATVYTVVYTASTLMLVFAMGFHSALADGTWHSNRYIGAAVRHWVCNPMHALLLTAMALSLFGLPPSWGFAVKASIAVALCANGYFALALIGLGMKTLVSVYYLKVVRMAYATYGGNHVVVYSTNVRKGVSLAVATFAAILWGAHTGFTP